jgi:hypothetical protein
VNKRYVIRSVFNPVFGSGFELRRKRLFWYEHIQYAWLRYDKDAANTLKATAKHLTQPSQ